MCYFFLFSFQQARQVRISQAANKCVGIRNLPDDCSNEQDSECDMLKLPAHPPGRRSTLRSIYTFASVVGMLSSRRSSAATPGLHRRADSKVSLKRERRKTPPWVVHCEDNERLITPKEVNLNEGAPEQVGSGSLPTCNIKIYVDDINQSCSQSVSTDDGNIVQTAYLGDQHRACQVSVLGNFADYFA